MNINKINVNGVEYDIQDKNTLDYLDEQLNNIYKKDEIDTKINEATQDKASIEYVDNALSNIDLSEYYNKEETNNKILEATNDKATTEYVDENISNAISDEVINRDNAISTAIGNLDLSGGTNLEDYGIYYVKVNSAGNFSVTLSSDNCENYDDFMSKLAICKTNQAFPIIIIAQFNYILHVFTGNDITSKTSFTMYSENFKGAMRTSRMKLYYDGTGVRFTIDEQNIYLTTDNTQSFAVNNLYTPAHKSYVDNKVNNAIGDINTILDSINGEVI